MAGIGFALRRLARSGTLGGLATAYAHATLVSAGPWLLTILAVAGINFFTIDQLATAEIATFRVVVIYNFAFSLVFSGPVVLIVTRYLADRIYAKNVEEAPGMLLGALGLIFLTQGPIAIAFYGFTATLPLTTRVVAVVSYLLTAALWLVTVFLSAIKDFR
ncbi:MAG: exopolysaccharide Pel transporter PelG [Gemmatimonadales bacterium]